MADVLDVAKMIVRHYDKIDTFKLQKLVYYSQAWHLVWDEGSDALFEDPIEAWSAGPVVRSLYERHRGRYSITDADASWGEADRLKPSERETVQAVIDGYGRLTGRQLSVLTHGEPPWRKAREGVGPTEASSNAISLADMYEYYSSLDTDDEGEAKPASDIEPADE